MSDDDRVDALAYGFGDHRGVKVRRLEAFVERLNRYRFRFPLFNCIRAEWVVECYGGTRTMRPEVQLRIEAIVPDRDTGRPTTVSSMTVIPAYEVLEREEHAFNRAMYLFRHQIRSLVDHEFDEQFIGPDDKRLREPHAEEEAEAKRLQETKKMRGVKVTDIIFDDAINQTVPLPSRLDLFMGLDYAFDAASDDPDERRREPKKPR